MKKKIGIVMIVIGLLPILYVLLGGLYNAINGWNGLCFFMCSPEYGPKVFFDFVILAGFVYWPILLLGLFLIIIDLILAIKKNKKIQTGGKQ